MTPLHMALYKQHDEAVVMAVLAAHPASTAACDEDGDTPLHLAVYKRHSANVVQSVLDANPAAALIQCKTGELPLYWALLHNYSPAVVDGIKATMPPELAQSMVVAKPFGVNNFDQHVMAA